jgi:hypothetical protein
MKILMFFSVMLTFAAATILLDNKHKVRELELKIAQLSGTLREAKEDCAALEGEMFLLTEPRRIEKLKNQYLPHHQRVRKDQLVKPLLPKAPAGPRAG